MFTQRANARKNKVGFVFITAGFDMKENK